MEAMSSAWHVLSAALVFLLGGALMLPLARYFRVPTSRGLFLYAWHTAFCLFYMNFSLSNVSDATGYYISSLQYAEKFELGTVFIIYFTSVFSVHLGMSYLGIFLVFNVFGSIGLLALYGALRIATADKSRAVRILGLLILLMPSVSFWTASLGKDAIAFMATGLALWSALEFGKRTVLLSMAVAAMLLVRPHIAAVMVLAFVISTLLSARLLLIQRVSLGSLALAGTAAMVPLTLSFVGLENASGSGDVIAYIEKRQGYNQEGGGGIDISSMSPPMQLFTYLFRPLPFEAHSLFALAASLDNLILLGLFIVGARRIFTYRSLNPRENRIFLWSYALIAWTILALTTANLGISVRQKWMFTPVLLYLLLSAARRVNTAPSSFQPVPAGSQAPSSYSAAYRGTDDPRLLSP